MRPHFVSYSSKLSNFLLQMTHTVLGNSFPLSWNFNFRCNLTDTEIDLLQRIMSFLSSVLFSSSLADSRAWSLSSSSLFSVRLFFLALSKVLNPILFLSGQVFLEFKSPFKGYGPRLVSSTWESKHQ